MKMLLCWIATGTKADEPVPDPLGLKEVDLRVYQKTLMDEETSTNVVSQAIYAVSIIVGLLRAVHVL